MGQADAVSQKGPANPFSAEHLGSKAWRQDLLQHFGIDVIIEQDAPIDNSVDCIEQHNARLLRLTRLRWDAVSGRADRRKKGGSRHIEV